MTFLRDTLVWATAYTSYTVILCLALSIEARRYHFADALSPENDIHSKDVVGRH